MTQHHVMVDLMTDKLLGWVEPWPLWRWSCPRQVQLHASTSTGRRPATANTVVRYLITTELHSDHNTSRYNPPQTQPSDIRLRSDTTCWQAAGGCGMVPPKGSPAPPPRGGHLLQLLPLSVNCHNRGVEGCTHGDSSPDERDPTTTTHNILTGPSMRISQHML